MDVCYGTKRTLRRKRWMAAFEGRLGIAVRDRLSPEGASSLRFLSRSSPPSSAGSPKMPRVAVTTPYFDFFPELKTDLAAMYSDAKFRSDRKPLSEDALIEYCKGYDAAVIGLDRFTDRVCAALPELKVISMCSAGVDHIDPAILKKHGKRMWWAAGINKVSVSELAVCYMVLTVRRVHFFSSMLRRGEWKGPIGMGADLRGRTVGIHGCGFIGKEVVKLLQPYGVKVLASDRVDYSDFYKEWGVEKVDADRSEEHTS